MIAAYFCLSPSAYFSARRQPDTVRWKEAAAIGAACVLLLCSIVGALAALWVFRDEQPGDAIEFDETAAEQIYANTDRNWAFSHVTQRSLQVEGVERLEYFF